MTVKHCRDEANCEGQASFFNFFLTASFLLSVQCHGALMHANKLLHGSRSVVKVNQCGMNFRKYANEAKYGPLGSRHLLMRHVRTTTIWGQDQQNKKSNNYFWSEGEKKKFPTAQGAVQQPHGQPANRCSWPENNTCGHLLSKCERWNFYFLQIGHDAQTPGFFLVIKWAFSFCI